MISIYSNVSKFFKTQHTIRCTVLQTDVVWMRAVTYGWEVFFKEKRDYKVYWKIVPLSHYRGTIKRVGQYKSS